MNEHDDIVADFVTLFRGRGDAHGTWEGGCKRTPVTAETYRGHLYGTEFIGIYPVVPMRGEARCVWGCSDIDIDDLDAARNLQTAFAVKQIDAWVEKTRKGYHVWVFSTSTVTAATMRRAFLAAHQAVDYPAKEVNPKQESVGAGFGNYVRLPYPNEYGPQPYRGEYNDIHVRFMLDDDDQRMPLSAFVMTAIASRATPEQLESIASLWVAPQRNEVNFDASTTDEAYALVCRAGGLANIIWRDGPRAGSDRSITLFRLAVVCRDSNLTPSETVEVIRSADLRWGKFHMRPDPDKEIYRLVSKVYGHG